jgi:hypothetical protein
VRRVSLKVAENGEEAAAVKRLDGMHRLDERFVFRDDFDRSDFTPIYAEGQLLVDAVRLAMGRFELADTWRTVAALRLHPTT